MSSSDPAAPALALNLAAGAETSAGALAATAAELGVPVHLSLRSLPHQVAACGARLC